MAYAEAAAHLSKVELRTGASPGTYVEIKGIFSGPSGIGGDPEFVEVRGHHRNDVGKIWSRNGHDQISWTMHYDSGDTTHAAIRTAFAAGTKSYIRVTLSDTGAEVYTCTGYFSFRVAADDGQTVQAQVGFTLDADPVVT